jgi:hypothetical protein
MAIPLDLEEADEKSMKAEDLRTEIVRETGNLQHTN